MCLEVRQMAKNLLTDYNQDKRIDKENIMTTIAVTNRKGGVGKTTTATNLSAGLATVGYNVGIVDTDSQGHISSSLNVPRKDSLFEILVDGDSLEKDKNVFFVAPDAYSTPDYQSKGNLYVIPGADKTYRIARDIEDTSNVFAFVEMIDEFKRKFDLHFVIVDTSPTLKDMDAQVSLAIDGYLYVTEPEALSIDGLTRAVKQMTAIARTRAEHMNRSTTILGILPNKVRNTDAHAYGMEQIEKSFGKYVLSPITLSTIWAEASIYQESIFTYAPSHNATKQLWKLTTEVLEAVKLWQTQKS